jgi:CubicO group peptidase (beta-lactamase class C family)
VPSIPRLPLVGDPLRRARIPKDTESVTTRGEEAPAGDGGMTQESVEKIWRDAVAWYRSGVHPALQLCVRRNGVIVLDRAIGHARGNGPGDPEDAEKVPVTPETPFTVYSAAKGVTAFVIHKLHEKGLLDIFEPVSAYIPEYARHGKEGITIAHVLSHRAGVPNLPREAVDLDRVDDRQYMLDILIDAKPTHGPGARLAYHAVSGGFILGEIAWRVAGKNIREVLQEEFCEPLGLRWTNYGVKAEDLEAVGRDYVTGPPILPPLSTLLTRALGLPFDELVATANDPRFLTSIAPAANLVTTARELSLFYDTMRAGGELGDRPRVMAPETIDRALEEQSHLELDYTLGFPTRFSYGLMLGARLVSLYGPDTQHAFGHLGFTNILSWADRERDLAATVITSGKPALYPELPRFLGLTTRITREAPKVRG